MGENDKSTLERIHLAAKREFLSKGFKSASLRNIVKSAGVTTGAFYGYYDSKEALFEALVGKQHDTILKVYCEAQENFARLPKEEQPKHMGDVSGACMREMLLYAYDNLEEFKLILCCSEGTRFENMIDKMVEVEIKGTHDYQEVLKQLGRPSPKLDSRLEHILITGMFNAFLSLSYMRCRFVTRRIIFPSFESFIRRVG